MPADLDARSDRPTPDRSGPEPSPPSFDAQADAYDRRAGLDEPTASAVAERIRDLAGLSAADLVVEVGAGTGALGLALAARSRYLGLDLSAGMLGVFADKARAARAAGAPGASGGPHLARADASRPWPVRPGAARAIVAARAAHLLPLDALADEVDRALAPAPGACIVLGRVVHAEGSPRALLRRALHDLVRERLGLRPREGGRAGARLAERLAARGFAPLDPVVAARIPVHESPRDALARWAAKPGLAGLDLAPADQRAVLAALEAWAGRHLAPLDVARSVEDEYVLGGARRT